MNRQIYALGLVELRNFGRSFNPTEGMIDAWYHRISKYSDDAMRLACLNLTHQATKIDFPILKKALGSAQAELDKTMDIPPIQGFAPRSPEKHQFELECVRHLAKAIKILDSEIRNAELKDLDNIWRHSYPQLPGYRTEGEVRELVNQKQFQTLLEMGFIKEIPIKRTVPQLQSERQSRDIMNNPTNVVRGDFNSGPNDNI